MITAELYDHRRALFSEIAVSPDEQSGEFASNYFTLG